MEQPNVPNPVVFTNAAAHKALELILEERNPASRATQAAVAPHDADVVPHEAADLLPVL